MGYYISIVPQEKIVWERATLLRLLSASGLEPHPDYPEEFLFADSGVVFISRDHEGTYGHIVAIRVSSAADPEDYMPAVRSLAEKLDGRPVFDQDTRLPGFEPMTMIVAQMIHQQITRSEHQVLVRTLERKAIDYAHYRAEWARASTEDRLEMDAARTRAHDAFIDAVNILSRAMVKSDEETKWRDTLGDDRKKIGDFACFLHLLLGLGAR